MEGRHRLNSELRRVPFGVWVVAILTVILSALRILSVLGIGPAGNDTVLTDLAERSRSRSASWASSGPWVSSA
jgi:hypothetical protein